MSYELLKSQLEELFPGVWADEAAIDAGVLAGALKTMAIATGVATDAAEYAQKQTRLSSATDTNVEAIAADFLGPGFPRYTIVTNGQAAPEDDRDYASRIAATIIRQENTLAAIQNAVVSYLKTGYQYEIALKAQVLGLDSEGGLDSYGPLDGRSSTVPPIPAVTTFDIQSDPVRSAKFGLTTGQFAIVLTYGLIPVGGFFLGLSHLDDETYLVPPGFKAIPPPTSTLAAIVESVKAEGFEPVWFDNNV